MRRTRNAPLVAQLRRLEQRLLKPAVRNSPAELAELLAPEFVDFGSSGRVFDRQQIIEALAGEAVISSSLADFGVRVLAPGVALATYRSIRRNASGHVVFESLRSSIWQRRGGRWRMVFHQGTPLHAPDAFPVRRSGRTTKSDKR
ncbi:MAG: nuclear transport factor 2 family protein [Planctomycetaceae bacterium]